VPGLLRGMGFQTRIAKLRIKPGKPFVFAVREAPRGRYVFGLPGNPVSAFVCTLRLASRLLTRLAGGVPRERWLSGRIDVGLPPNGPREFYQPVVRQVPAGISSAQNELATIHLLPWKGSADLFTLAQANALLVRPENEPPVAKGTLVRVLEI
jgi:molybdopterin molybdotransferase